MRSNTQKSVAGCVYSTEEGMHRLDYSMSDMSVPQRRGWLQTKDEGRVPVAWAQGGHTWCYWKRVVQ
jgi:hypothetical protein